LVFENDHMVDIQVYVWQIVAAAAVVEAVVAAVAAAVVAAAARMLDLEKATLMTAHSSPLAHSHYPDWHSRDCYDYQSYYDYYCSLPAVPYWSTDLTNSLDADNAGAPPGSSRSQT